MGQRWAAAVAAAGETPPADLPAAVAEDLIALRSDLCEAQRRAARPVLAGRVRRAGRADRHAAPAHHGDVVAVDTGAPAGQRRLPGHPAVSGRRLHPAGHRRDAQRDPGPADQDLRPARRHRPSRYGSLVTVAAAGRARASSTCCAAVPGATVASRAFSATAARHWRPDKLDAGRAGWTRPAAYWVTVPAAASRPMPASRATAASPPGRALFGSVRLAIAAASCFPGPRGTCAAPRRSAVPRCHGDPGAATATAAPAGEAETLAGGPAIPARGRRLRRAGRGCCRARRVHPRGMAPAAAAGSHLMLAGAAAAARPGRQRQSSPVMRWACPLNGPAAGYVLAVARSSFVERGM